MNTLALNISNTPVRQDSEGRYNLNDLHKASGGEGKNKPSNWQRTQQAIELIGLLESEQSIGAIPPIVTKQGLGTFSVKDLVYAYAMWISPAFTLKVIHAYDSLVSAQYGLKESPTLPAPRAKIYVKGGLELHQQDAINDFIKERVAIVPADKRKGITVMIYSAICIKFDVKGMTHGYKNIAPEQFDNIIQLIARLPIHDEKAMLFLTQDELDTLIAERVKAIEGELLPKETEPAEPGEKRFLIKIKGDRQTIEPVDINCYYMTEERFICHLKNSGRVVFDKTGASARQIVMHHIPPQFLPDMIEEAWAMLRRIEADKLKA